MIICKRQLACTFTQKMSHPHYFHCATKGLEKTVLFQDAREFIAGMNRVAFCLASIRQKYVLTIICFCLMDNHVHFILHGTREACMEFMRLYERLTGIWLANHRDGFHIEENWIHDSWLIPDRDNLQEKIAYVHRNPIVAGIPLSPAGYRWSSANLPFSDHTFIKSICKCLGGYSVYEKRKMLETKILLPDDWLLLPDGMIWPGSYTNYQLMENVFGSIGRYLFSLNQKVEAHVNQEMMSDSVSLPDGDIKKMLTAISLELFAQEDLQLLSLKQRIDLCRRLRKTVWANSKQLARVVGISPKDLKEIIG